MEFFTGTSKTPPENAGADSLGHEIASMLTEKGVMVKTHRFPRIQLLECSGPGGHGALVLPVEINCSDEEQAVRQSVAVSALKTECIRHFKAQGADCPGIISVPEDRWKRQRDLTAKRLLAHCGYFVRIHARNCEVRRIDKPEAQAFMAANHSYGPAVCRYCYGLFIKKCSGEKAQGHPPGTLVAAAEFSNARKWIKSGKEIRSYEWIRYASLPGLRIAGGMGKILSHFIEDVNPDDIMSYADTEWSDGEVYARLGFTKDGIKAPVLFRIDPATWERRPVKAGRTPDSESMYYMNSGSIKYRLKLTQWEEGAAAAE